MMPSWMRVLFVAAVSLAAVTRSFAAGVFDVKGRPPVSAIVTIGEHLPEREPTSPMIDQLAGVLARLDKAQCLELRAAGSGPLVAEPDDGLRPLCTVHVSNGAATRAVDVLRDSVGMYYASDRKGTSGAKDGKVYRLNGAKFAKLAARWSGYRGEYKLPTGVTPGKASVLEAPYTPGVYYLDKALIGERMLSGRSTSLTATKRDLMQNPLHVRLPGAYNPRQAHGLLVYVDPMEKSAVHPFLHQAADELGLIVVAAERIGNTVYAPDRWQLALDCVASVSERYLVDQRRVYITGISGGGQISTHMCLCFPEVFAGAVPIVALGSYENIPTGTGQMWLGTFGKPSREVFKLAQERRVCAITGSKDFNQKIVHEGARILTRDGINIRVNDYAEMGHTAPTPERFADALRWVDDPYRTTHTTELAAAELLLRTTLEDTTVTEEARTAALIEVTRLGAWSPAAWKAVELLDPRLVPPPDRSPPK